MDMYMYDQKKGLAFLNKKLKVFVLIFFNFSFSVY